MRTATLQEFVGNNRFLTPSCDPSMSHVLKLFTNFSLKRKHKEWFLRKIFDVSVELDKMLKDCCIGNQESRAAILPRRTEDMKR
jgi:hypothetical protein